IDVTGRIQSDALRRVELRVDGWAAIARESGARIARNQRERTGAIDIEDRVTAAEIEIGAGDGQLPRLTDGSIQGRHRGGRGRAAGDGGNGVLLREGSYARQQQDRESQHACRKSRG